MHRFFVPQLYNETMTIEGVDARHISKVLRMQPGAQLQIVSDDGVSALAEITAIDSECVTVHCLEKLAESHEPAVRLILAQGLAKGEKMEFIIQKAVEMGAYSVVPVAMEHSVVRLDGAKAAKKVERWQKIAESAAKQSKRDIIPEVQPVQTMAQMLAANDCATKIIAYECEDKKSLKAALKERKRALDEACAALTDARREAAAELCRRLVEQLADLGMGRTRFDVRFTPRAPQADGADEVEFILSPNPGEPMKPLSAIASGGEISRIMLAMKAISAENEGVDTMIFDEIDTGVSGRMAQTVGEKMCALGRSRQVICVTHLAQIAALGDSQYLVEKTVKDGHTGSSVRRLDEEGRVGELARLVGGADDSASGREHARSMLAAAETLKKKRF